MQVEHYTIPRVSDVMDRRIRSITGAYFIGIMVTAIYFQVYLLIFAIFIGIPAFFWAIKTTRAKSQAQLKEAMSHYKNTLGWQVLTVTEYEWLVENEIDCTIRVYREPVEPVWDWQYVQFNTSEGKFLFDLTFAS